MQNPQIPHKFWLVGFYIQKNGKRIFHEESFKNKPSSVELEEIKARKGVSSVGLPIEHTMDEWGWIYPVYKHLES